MIPVEPYPITTPKGAARRISESIYGFEVGVPKQSQ